MKRFAKLLCVTFATVLTTTIVAVGVAPQPAHAASKNYWISVAYYGDNPSSGIVKYNKKKNKITVSGYIAVTKSKYASKTPKKTKKRTYRIAPKCKIEAIGDSLYAGTYRTWKKTGQLKFKKTTRPELHHSKHLKIPSSKKCFTAPCTTLKIRNNKVVAIVLIA